MIKNSIRVLSLALMASATSAFALDVALLSSTSGQGDIELNLQSAGHTVTIVSVADVEGGALTGQDAFVFGRVYSGNTITQSFIDQVVAFINGGGGVVTEWDAFAFLFSGQDPTFRYIGNGLPQSGLISGDVGGGQGASDDLLIENAMPHPVWGNIGATLQTTGVEFPYTNYNADLSDWDVVATWTGDGSANFPAQAFPIIIAGRTLPVVGIGFDWGDDADEPVIIGLYTRAVEWSADFAPAGPVGQSVPIPVNNPVALIVLLILLAGFAAPAIRGRLG